MCNEAKGNFFGLKNGNDLFLYRNLNACQMIKASRIFISDVNMTRKYGLYTPLCAYIDTSSTLLSASNFRASKAQIARAVFKILSTFSGVLFKQNLRINLFVLRYKFLLKIIFSMLLCSIDSGVG